MMMKIGHVMKKFKVLAKLDDSDDSYTEEFEGEWGEVIIVELEVKRAAEKDHVLVEYNTASAAVVY